jgi:hypothetical protein
MQAQDQLLAPNTFNEMQGAFLSLGKNATGL